MDFRIALEWDEECGLSMRNMYPLREAIEAHFQQKCYGTSVKKIWIVLGFQVKDYKQRKRYVKGERMLTFDILMDFQAVRNAQIEEKKKLVRAQLIETTEELLKKYKFEDFATDSFIVDFKNVVNDLIWV